MATEQKRQPEIADAL